MSKSIKVIKESVKGFQIIRLYTKFCLFKTKTRWSLIDPDYYYFEFNLVPV